MSTEENGSVKSDEVNVEQTPSSDLPVSPEQTGSVPKKKLSILCLIGFLTPIISCGVLIVMLIKYSIEHDSVAWGILSLVLGPLVPCLIASTVALVICLIGIPVSLVMKRRGWWLGAAGAVFALPAPVCILILLALKATLTASLSNIHFSPTFYYPDYSGPTIQCDDYSVKLKDRDGIDLSEGAALKWYWDGDPDHTMIRSGMVNNDQTKITSIGYCNSYSAGLDYESFQIVLPEDMRYPGFDPVDFYIDDPKDHLDDYGIEPGTKVIFDEIEFHVLISPDIKHVCAGYPHIGDEAMYGRMPNHFLVMENEDGSITFYRYYLTFECDEDTERFHVDNEGSLVVNNEEDGSLAYVNRKLYKAFDKFEPFEMIYEGKPKPEKKQVEDFLLSISPENQKICAEEYYLYDYPEDMEIVPVLSPKKEMTISGLGGTQGEEELFFRIIPPESKIFRGYVPGDGDPKDHLDEYGIEPGTKVIFDEVEFTIVMNRAITEVKLPPADNENIYMVMENEDGSITFYRCFIRFDCSKVIFNYYADEDGVLFSDHTKEPIDIDPGWYKSKNTDYKPFEMIYEGPAEEE